MAGTREINSDLEVKGTVNIMTVPDATGNFLTWAPGGGVSRRVPSDVRLDIGAEAAANKVQNFLSPDNTTYPTTQAVADYVDSQIPSPQTLSQPSLGQIAISGGNSIDLGETGYGLGKPFDIGVGQELGSLGFTGFARTRSSPDAPAGIGGNAFVISNYIDSNRGHQIAASVASDRIYFRRNLDGWQPWVEIAILDKTVNTSGNQTGIAGNKTTTGVWTFQNNRIEMDPPGEATQAFVRFSTGGTQKGYVGKSTAGDVIRLGNYTNSQYFGIEADGSARFSMLSGTGNGIVGVTANGTLTRTNISDFGYVPYTGASQGVNLNTQSLNINGNFIKGPNTFERNVLKNEGGTNLHLNRVSNVASATQGLISGAKDILITLPGSLNTTTRYTLNVLVEEYTAGSALSITGYNNSTPRAVSVVSGTPTYVSSVTFGSIDGRRVIVISVPNFRYGRVNLEDVYYSVSTIGPWHDPSNYNVEIFDAGTIEDLDVLEIKTNDQFTRDPYYLDYNNLTNKPTIPANQTLSLGTGAGEIAISGGNSVDLSTLQTRHLTGDLNFSDYLDGLGRHSFEPFTSTLTVESEGWIGNQMIGFALNQTLPGADRRGTIVIGKTRNTNSNKLSYNLGINNAGGMTGWQTFLSEELAETLYAKPADIGDGTLSLETGTGLQGSANFSANQSGSSTFTVEAASGYTIPTTAQATNWTTAYDYSQIGHLELSGGTVTGQIKRGADAVAGDDLPRLSQVQSLISDASTGGTVTSVGLSVPTGLSVSGSPITTSGTINIGFETGYSIPTIDKQGEWDSKQDNLVSGTTIKTINGTSILGSGNIVTPNDNTTYTAGDGLTLSGTTFSLPITTTGTGTYVQSVAQTATGLTVTLGTPPNTTYSLMSAAELNTGTATTARSISAERLNTWLNSKNFLTSVSWGDVTGKPSEFTPTAHTHNASDINAGTLGIARIPTGTTGSTVALGNHTHTFASITSKPNTLAGYGITDAYTKSEVDGLIPDTDNFVTLDGAQTISGEKTLTNTLNIGDESSIVFSESDPLRRSVIQRSEVWPYGIDIIIPGGISANQAMFTLRRRVASSELLVDILQIDGQTGNAYFSGLNFGVANSLTTNNFTSAGQSTVAYLTVTGELGLPGTVNQIVRGDGSIGALPAQSMAMNDLTDVTITTPLHGDLLSWNGSINQWVNVSQSSLQTFSTNINGQVPAPGAGTNTRVLQANGQWVEPSGGGITALTGDVVASGVGSVAATIANNAVTLNKLATIPQNRFIGRYSAGTGDPQLMYFGSGFSVNTSTGEVTVTGGSTPTPVNLGSGTSIDTSSGNKFYATRTNGATYSITMSAGEDLQLQITNSGGSEIPITFSTSSAAGVAWPYGVDGLIPPGATVIFSFTYINNSIALTKVLY